MLISDLATDPDLVPSTLTDPFQRSLRAGFITVRVRRMLDSDQSLRVSTYNRSELRDDKVDTVKTKLTSELGNAAARVGQAETRMANYEAAGKLVSLENIEEAFLTWYFKNKFLSGTKADQLKAGRKSMITTIAWWATASDERLQDSQKIDDLVEVVDHRLRVAERMLYYVAENSDVWVPAGPTYVDGKQRVFEYPGGANISLSTEAKNFWEGPGAPGNYTFRLKQNVTSPAAAVRKIFDPRNTDRKKRNLLFCDQVIQSLHIEGFMEAKRNRTGSDAEFDQLVNAKPQGWLRIGSPWNKNISFLVGRLEPNHFEHVVIGIPDLQIGDHLVVYNHPVFDALLPESEWRLENSIVVRLHPVPRVQGHGLMPMTLPELKLHLIKECNEQLTNARERVENDPKVETPTDDPNDPYPTITLPGAQCIAIRRVRPAQSEFLPKDNKADWWLRWVPSQDREGERDLYTQVTPPPDWNAKRAFVKKHQKVEFVVQGSNPGEPRLEGAFFPLWEPVMKGDPPVPDRNAQGKFKRAQDVTIGEPMASLASWYFPDPFSRGTTTVIRPKL
jgi:hypothetical protein